MTGDDVDASEAVDTVTVNMPSSLKQEYLEVPARYRLVALASFLRHELCMRRERYVLLSCHIITILDVAPSDVVVAR